MYFNARSVCFLYKTHFDVFCVSDFTLYCYYWYFLSFWYQICILHGKCILMPVIVFSAQINRNIETQLYFIKYLLYLDVFHNHVDFKHLLVIWGYMYSVSVWTKQNLGQFVLLSSWGTCEQCRKWRRHNQYVVSFLYHQYVGNT